MRKSKNNYRVIITTDPESTLTKEEVIKGMEWLYREILFNIIGQIKFES